MKKLALESSIAFFRPLSTPMSAKGHTVTHAINKRVNTKPLKKAHPF